MKCRNGLRVLGADVSGSSSWQITVDVNENRRSATVTASTASGNAAHRLLINYYFRWRLVCIDYSFFQSYWKKYWYCYRQPLAGRLSLIMCWSLLKSVFAECGMRMLTCRFVWIQMLFFMFCSIQELFSWLVEVDGSVEEGDRGRIVFTLEYEMTRDRREVYAPVRNKAVAFVSFQQDSTLAVLPVIKVGISFFRVIVL